MAEVSLLQRKLLAVVVAADTASAVPGATPAGTRGGRGLPLELQLAAEQESVGTGCSGSVR